MQYAAVGWGGLVPSWALATCPAQCLSPQIFKNHVCASSVITSLFLLRQRLFQCLVESKSHPGTVLVGQKSCWRSITASFGMLCQSLGCGLAPLEVQGLPQPWVTRSPWVSSSETMHLEGDVLKYTFPSVTMGYFKMWGSGLASSGALLTQGILRKASCQWFEVVRISVDWDSSCS